MQIHACRHAQLKSLGGKPIIWRRHESFVPVFVIKRARFRFRSLYFTWPRLQPPSLFSKQEELLFPAPMTPSLCLMGKLGSAEPQWLCICWVSAPARPGMSQHPTVRCCTWQNRKLLPWRHAEDFTPHWTCPLSALFHFCGTRRM